MLFYFFTIRIYFNKYIDGFSPDFANIDADLWNHYLLDDELIVYLCGFMSKILTPVCIIDTLVTMSFKLLHQSQAHSPNTLRMNYLNIGFYRKPTFVITLF